MSSPGRSKLSNMIGPTYTHATPERLSTDAFEEKCECGDERRDHFPAADAITTGKVCTGRCKRILCTCVEFRPRSS